MSYDSMLPIPPTNSLRKILKNILKNVQENVGLGRKKKKKKKKEDKIGLGRKTRKGDSKVESNDSPEIPDGRETSDTTRLPSGARVRIYFNNAWTFL